MNQREAIADLRGYGLMILLLLQAASFAAAAPFLAIGGYLSGVGRLFFLVVGCLIITPFTAAIITVFLWHAAYLRRVKRTMEEIDMTRLETLARRAGAVVWGLAALLTVVIATVISLQG